MKKKYIKPLIAIERFSMIQTATRDCGYIIPSDELVNLQDSACAWDLGLGDGLYLFSVGVNQNCTVDESVYGDACYNNPNETSLVFRS